MQHHGSLPVTSSSSLAASAQPVLQPIFQNLDRAFVELTLAKAVGHHNAGQPALTLSAVRSLQDANVTEARPCVMLGLLSVASGAPAEGLAWFDRALALEPTSLDALNGRATALSEMRADAEANLAFAAAFAAGCNEATAYYNHGNVLRRLGDTDAAIVAYDEALRLQPAYPEALCAGGQILRDAGRYDEALRFFHEALRLKPNYLDAIIECANLLDAVSHGEEALTILDAGLAAYPGNPDLLNNRGVILFHLQRYPEALGSLDQALMVEPNYAAAHLNKGEVKIRQGLFTQALRDIERALALRPNYIQALCAKGIAEKLMGRFDEAAASFEAALHLSPNDPYALTNRGELRLLRGDMEQGWVDYNARWFTRGHEAPLLAWPVPQWTPEMPPGHVLVFVDQASGDVIQFARYLNVLRAAGNKVTLVCRTRLHRLLRPLTEGMIVLDHVPETGDYTAQIPLTNLPYACRTTEATIPPTPYLFAEMALVEEWRRKIGPDGFKIGLCWRGSQDRRADPKRSVPLESLAALASIPNVRLFSLQMAENLGADAATIQRMRIENLADALDRGPDGFVDTAAAMANMDLIVSCDTSIGHLAGALGLPTCLLLQFVPEWRFMIGRDDSPWYPSIRLLRQAELDKWDRPVEQLIGVVKACMGEG